MSSPTPVQLANEVITLVRAQRLQPHPGAVMEAEKKFPLKGYPLRSFLTSLKACRVCASGALLFAYVVNHTSILSPGQHPFNAYCPNWETVNLSEGMYATLAKIFSPLQLRLIEHAFEGLHHEKELRGKVLIACKEFYRQYPSATLRLKAIMQNIIDNNGTFRP